VELNMVPLAIPLEPLLAAMATYVLGEIGVDATKKMLKHGSIADEAGRAKAATATQSCPAKPDDDDPCKHLRNGNPNGKGKYRGGAHREMSKNKGDGLDSHHMPANQANKMGVDHLRMMLRPYKWILVIIVKHPVMVVAQRRHNIELSRRD
jgi:hypothetical protein